MCMHTHISSDEEQRAEAAGSNNVVSAHAALRISLSCSSFLTARARRHAFYLHITAIAACEFMRARRRSGATLRTRTREAVCARGVRWSRFCDAAGCAAALAGSRAMFTRIRVLQRACNVGHGARTICVRWSVGSLLRFSRNEVLLRIRIFYLTQPHLV